MKKEITFLLAISLFALAYFLDYVAGPISTRLTSPLEFTQKVFITRYPLTSVAVAVRSFAITLLLFVSLSMIGKQYFFKAIGVVILAILFELYAIQQLATGGVVTTTQWTLSLALAPVLICLLVVYYLIKGFLDLFTDDPYPNQKSLRNSDDGPKEFNL